MRKRILLFGLIALLLAISTVSADFQFEIEEGVPCKDKSNYERLVGGNTPNSATGYGAIDICNTCYICGEEDGVCPEDFYSTDKEIQASCRNYPDPDCTATVIGKVQTLDGNPVEAEVFVTTGKGQKSLGLSDSDNGEFTFDNAVAGNVKFHASYADYDTDIVSMEIIRGMTHTGLVINVSPGACNDECTDIFGNVCKAKCQGMNDCYFTNPQTEGYDVTSDEVAQHCDGYAPGTRFPIDENTTHITYASCCEGPIVHEKRPELLPLDEEKNNCINNLGTHITKAKYKGQTVRVVVKSWDSNCR